MLVTQDIMDEAKRRILPKGYKAEDYALLGRDYAFRIAALVAKEALHIAHMREAERRLEEESSRRPWWGGW